MAVAGEAPSYAARLNKHQVPSGGIVIPGAPWTNYAALLFFGLVALSNLSSAAGRWTLGLFALVLVAMAAGWRLVARRQH